MLEQPFTVWSLALRQDRTPRLVMVLTLRLVKQQGMPEAFFDEVAQFLTEFEDVPGTWTRAGPYDFALAPLLNDRAALDFSMRVRNGVRARHARFAQAHDLPELDQAKTIQPFTWPTRRVELNEALRGLMEVQTQEGSWRPLALTDIQALGNILPSIPAEEWRSRVMATQTVMFLDQERQAKPWVREHFCRIAQVRQLIDPGIDLRGNDLMFALMLGLLDLKVLETAHLWADAGRWSINLSVATLLSREFAVFVNTVGLKGGMVEIKQSDLLMQYHRSLKAIAALRDAGCAVAIDLVWADSLGVVAYDRIPGISAVKIPWKGDQAERLEGERGTLRRFLDAGIVPVLTRVGDQGGIDAGLRSGIRAFQGQHVSDTYGLDRGEE